METVIKVKTYFKNDIARWNIVTISVFTTLLVVSNILGVTIYGQGSGGDMWVIWLSLFSSFFGMLNVMTYSLMNLNDDDKRDRFRIFIVFNSIAVISLAIINGYYGLWILLLENLLFFFSGCLQYYNWFIKPQIKEDGIFTFSRYDKRTDSYLFAIAILLIIVFTSVRINFMQLNGSIEHISYSYSRAFLDPLLGVGGMLGAFMVARRKYFSVYIYLINDTFLILFWFALFLTSFLTTDFAASENITTLTSLNLMILFLFYLLSNVFNYVKWKPNLDAKKV